MKLKLKLLYQYLFKDFSHLKDLKIPTLILFT